MLVPTSRIESFLFSTALIQIETYDGESGSGTGFFFEFPSSDGTPFRVLVTNKHVVTNAFKGNFLMHEREEKDGVAVPGNHSFSLEFDQFNSYFIPHPHDDVDLCAMPVAFIEKKAAEHGKALYGMCLDANLIETDEELLKLNAVEDVLMAGYPNGLWDEVNNLPLVRRGITATPPSVDFCGKSITVIDCACFPGSSGSPVVIMNEGGGWVTKDGSLIAKGSREILLGVLFQGPQTTVEGKIIMAPIPTYNSPIALTPIMLHLGHIVKAKELLVLAEHIKKTPT